MPFFNCFFVLLPPNSCFNDTAMRQIPTITKNLLVINILAYLATVVLQMRGIDLTHALGLHFFLAPDFRLYQLLTYMFMHGSLTHLFFNMFALWMFGCTIERAWGPKRFLYFTLACGIGAGLVQEMAQYGSYLVQGLGQYDSVNMDGFILPMTEYLNRWNTVGFSGAVYGILLGFGMTYPEERIFIFPLPFPIKGKWFVMIYAAVELFSALSTQGDGVAHVAHLGGMLFGYLIIRYWKYQYQHSAYGQWDGYEIHTRPSLWVRLREWFYSRKPTPKNPGTDNRQAELDRILEKIKRSGYDSLSDEERRKLFDRK